MNRLYKPGSAVGEVLLSVYAEKGGGNDKDEQAWEKVEQSEEYTQTAQRIADLVGWKIPGATQLSNSFKALLNEADSWVYFDYPNLLTNFEKIKNEARSAHDRWKNHAELEDFVTKFWRHVSKEYVRVKAEPPSRIKPDLYGRLMEAEKNFMAEFSKPDYARALKPLDALQTALWAVLDDIEGSRRQRDDLTARYHDAKKPHDELEDRVKKISASPEAQAFQKSDANMDLLRMRQAHSRAIDAVNRLTGDAQVILKEWTLLVSRSEKIVEEFEKQHPKQEKVAQPNLDSDPNDVKLVALERCSDEVYKNMQEAQDAVPPKRDDGDPTIAALKKDVAEAFEQLEASKLNKNSGPLFDEFNRLYALLNRELLRLNTVSRPVADLAARHITELAQNGLLPVLNVKEKLDLLNELRISCAPFVVGLPRTLTELGKAHVELIGALTMDEDFRKVDRERRQAIANALVEKDEDKKQFKRALTDWMTTPEDERLSICEKIVATQCSILKIEPCPLLLAKGAPDTAGWLERTERTIFINNDQQSAFHYSFEAVSNTLFHETSHWWQLLRVEAFNRGEIDSASPEYLQILLFACNDKSAHPSAYVSSELGGNSYKRQPMEAHAYEVGDETERLFLKALMS